MAAPMTNVFVGSETGLLKGINVGKGTWRNLNKIETPNKANEITCMCWNDQSECSYSVGLNSQLVANFDVESQTLSDFKCEDGGSGAQLKCIAKNEDTLITAYDSGLVCVKPTDDSLYEIMTGPHLQSLAVNKNIIGTGGKESDLKLYDINSTESELPIFQAKNVRNDWLNLRVPVWVTGIIFMAESKIVTSTGHHQVRIYDPNVQRRPVLDMTFDEYPITAMSSCSDFQVVVGNTQGSMALLDIRKGKLVHRFKGFAGGIRSIQCHASLPVVASCGLDRYFRVHDINTKDLLHKMYLKSRLNCLLMSKRDWSKDASDNEDMTDEKSEISNIDVEEEEYDDEANADDVWEQMDVVKTRTLKRKTVAVTGEEKNTKKLSCKKAQTGKNLKRT